MDAVIEPSAPALQSALHRPPAAVLRLRVPVIARLASRALPVAQIRTLSLGMIVEFDRSVHEPIELRVNNHCIACGDAVKCNDHFGLRITSIQTPQERAASLSG